MQHYTANFSETIGMANIVESLANKFWKDGCAYGIGFSVGYQDVYLGPKSEKEITPDTAAITIKLPYDAPRCEGADSCGVNILAESSTKYLVKVDSEIVSPKTVKEVLEALRGQVN